MLKFTLPEKFLVYPENSVAVRIYFNLLVGKMVKTDSKDIAHIRNWRFPVQADKASHHRRFVRNFTKTAAPLQRLTKQNMFTWTKNCATSFQMLEETLIHTVFLAALKVDDHLLLFNAETSDVRIDAVLSEEQE